MRRHILLLVLALVTVALRAQDYRIVSMTPTSEMAARENIKLDFKERQCAVFRIATQNITPSLREGFHFESDYGSNVVDRQIVGGEIWLWVSPGIKTLKIYHSRLGNIELHTANYGVTVQSLYTYKIVMRGTMTVDPNEITQQFLVFKVSPKDAVVTVNGSPWPVVDGVAQKRVDFGRYEYRIEAEDYHSEEGTVTVDDPESKVVVEKSLKPAFGYLKLEGDNGILSQSSIHIDNANGADAVRTAKRVSSGQHRVRVVHPKYKPFDQTVTVSDGEVSTVTVDLNANYSTVTLTVDADAEIWVNGQKKGVRTWTGDLEAGSYTFECRMESHKPSIRQMTVSENMTGQTIVLESPTPLTGVLVVSTTPMANLYIDGKSAGETPIQTTLTVGKHSLRMEKKGYQPLTKTVTIEENKTLEVEEQLEATPEPKVKEKPKKEEKKKEEKPKQEKQKQDKQNQDKQKQDAPKQEKPAKENTWFATLNFAYDPAPQLSYGFCVGSVKKFGWFVTAMSNFDFRAMQYDYTADADGCVEGNYPVYTGETCSTRVSVMAGAMWKVASPLSLRAGVGYGMRMKSWGTADNALVRMPGDSWTGVDISLGAQFQLKRVVLSVDAVTTGFESVEAKVGVGYSF